ncbi:hypothetical protein ACHAWO_013451 [Cyclotella atomus]|uniref:Uncharacterized protein n=1 Tax=Cyclotella atomus TaxID=382360 RepID=A0ABD3PAW0_9STRA
MNLVNDHFRGRDDIILYSWDTVKYTKLQNLSGQIGYLFLDIFELLITPPHGSRILEEYIKTLRSKPLREYFSLAIAQHVYYIAGFLCRAGEKEMVRRTDNKEVGECIGAINDHYSSSSAEIEQSNDLPEKLAELVNKRSVHGGLKYPNWQVYALAAKMEYCYSKLATPGNLTTFGGVVLSYITEAIANNTDLLDHFKGLFKEDRFKDETIAVAFKYYVKVFANLRLKDLCRTYNSELHKINTANLRAGLATKGNTTTKTKKIKHKSRSKSSETVATEEEIHNDMLEISDGGIDIITNDSIANSSDVLDDESNDMTHECS